MRALVVLEEKLSKASLRSFLEEKGLLPYVEAGLMVVLMNGKALSPSELAFCTVSPKDKVVIVPMARGG